MPPKRKYNDEYIKFGFTDITVNKEVRPQCVICTTVLSNDALKPAKLERHLKTVHPNLSDRSREFFEGKKENFKKMKLGTSGARFETSEKVLHTSYEISLLIAKSKKPHTIGETLIKPCLLKATEEILGKEAVKKIQDIPLSNNTVKSRIGNMSQDIEEQLICLIKKSPWFALQCDESTDVAQCCQLLIFVRFLSGDNTIKEELLLSQVLETTSKGVDVMKIILDYFEKHKLMWENLAGFCTDGAPAMLGSRSGLATLVKQKNPTILTTHCIIHRQALTSKTLPKDLAFAMKISIQLVNAVKNSALNTRVFQKLCANMDAEHETLLFHTETRWLSKGNMLARLFELREELKVFLIDKGMNYLHEQLCEPKIEMQIAYLADIFAHLNHLNLQLQGSGNVKLEGSANIFVFEDKVRAFVCKINLWIDKTQMKNYSVFPTLRVLIDDEHYKCFTEDIQNNVLEHLRVLKEEFTRYFPEYGVVDTDVVKKLIRNPFIVEVNNVQEEMQEELIDLQNDSNLKSSFEFSTNLEEFWCKKAMGYPNIRQTALRFLMVFSTTYLCEQGFSSLLSIKNKQRNRLNPSDDMRLALSNSIVPRISQLVKEARPNKSH